MPRTQNLLAAALLLSICASAQADPFPRPPAHEPQVRFWTRVYSEIDRRGGFIHDSRHLGVIYEVHRIPEGLSSRNQERRIERVKKHYASILRKLATGRRTGLSAEEKRVLALWPADVSNSTLRNAARQVRFQLGQADRFRTGLDRSGKWMAHIRASLRRHGVPEELSALPHVESSFNPAAYSRVGAAGLWQFTRSTGRLFLRVDNVVDERMDPFLASDGAARLLRSNYAELGSWPLAITAYNHGVGGMRRAVRKLGTDDIGVIVDRYKSRSFGFASRNFYAEFLAALDVDRNAEGFFGPQNPEPPVEYQVVKLEGFYPAEAVELALGVDRETLREHNRSLRPSVWNGAKYMPEGFELKIPRAAMSGDPQIAMASIPDHQRFAKQHRDRLYKVRRGDTLSRIARRYHVKQRELVALNNLRSRHSIRAGQILTLPDEPGARAPVSVARSAPPKDGVYRVRRGDTVSTISARFGLSESRLVAINDLRNRNMISVGQKLRVAEDRTPVVVAAATPPVPPPTPKAEVVPEPAPTPEPVVVAAVAIADLEPEPEPIVEPPTLLVDEPEVAPALGPDAGTVRPVGSDPVIPKPDPSDYSITADGRITVQAAETLGHYADWLKIPTQRLRRINGIRYGTPVAIGRRTKLDFSRVSRETFEQRRLQYHHTLQEEFFSAYEVTGTDTHVLRRGDTLWYLAEKRFRVPVWLLRQYNPTLDFGALQAGARMIIPRISPLSDS